MPNSSILKCDSLLKRQEKLQLGVSQKKWHRRRELYIELTGVPTPHRDQIPAEKKPGSTFFMLALPLRKIDSTGWRDESSSYISDITDSVNTKR